MSAAQRLLLLTLSFAVVLVVSAQSADCSRHCYSGTLLFSEQDPADFSIGYTPCTDTAEGQINNEEVTTFECTAQSGARVTLQFASEHYTLTWSYTNSSGCASAFSDGRGIFAGALFVDSSDSSQVRNITLGADDAGSLQDYSSVCGSDCAERCFDVAVTLNGVAGLSSPCGLENATECEVTVLFTVVPCSGLVEQIEILIGSGGVPMSHFDPAQLASPSFTCVGNGQLQLRTAGLEMQWEPEGVDCDTLMSDLSGAGTAPVAMVVLAADDELWAHEGPQTPGSALSLATCALVNPDADIDDETVNEAYYAYKPAKKPLQTFVNCSSHNSQYLPSDTCCTIFGYNNLNDFNVWTHRVQGSNWFVPGPSNRSQRRKFLANTKTLQSFGVLWDCNRHTTTKFFWLVRHLGGSTSCSYEAVEEGVTKECDDSTSEVAASSYYYWNEHSMSRKYLIRTGVDMERDDCSDDDIVAFCVPDARRR